MTAAATSASRWQRFYSQNSGSQNANGARYPTEWVVRTLAGGQYPHLAMDRSDYPGSRILDLSCGDGRNIPLLLDLQFNVTATEISSEHVESLKNRAESLNWPVSFEVARNDDLPFEDRRFGYLLACSSLYYLDGSTSWSDVVNETARVLDDDGLLVGNFPDAKNSVLRNAELDFEGAAKITDDPFLLRNGIRFMVARDADHIAALLGDRFEVISVGHQQDDYYGLMVSGFFFVARRRVRPGNAR